MKWLKTLLGIKEVVTIQVTEEELASIIDANLKEVFIRPLIEIEVKKAMREAGVI